MYIYNNYQAVLNVKYTSTFEESSNGLCPRLHISYMTQPKLHTSLATEYFLKLRAYSSKAEHDPPYLEQRYTLTSGAVHLTGILPPWDT